MTESSIPNPPNNAYKVWIDDLGYLIIVASSRSRAHMMYLSEVEYDAPDAWTCPISIRLLEKGVEFSEGVGNFNGYIKSREIDLIMAGVINPYWHEESFDDEWAD